ncbi:MAG: protein phosphatase 2C domain-containing protein [Candidatus Electryonea clarkiae]|nr:protein phosphatase 2C domain-containing protein [Candidatus Electryonea clarkiae]MDP8288584.1 protein phosphatase 2C domain-containing protein [Candidatus Electryonea clarkiae]
MINHFGYSDQGPREENQDAFGSNLLDDGKLILGVADGVGGSNCGQKAAKLSIDEFIRELSIDSNCDLENLLLKIHHNIKKEAEKNPKCSGMSTTFSGCILSNNQLNGIHTGDSRILVFRKNGVKQLTTDHTEANRLLEAGKLTKEEAYNYPRKNILDSALGMNGNLIVNKLKYALIQGDRILLITDGVHNVITKLELRDISKESSTPEEFVIKIIIRLCSKRLTDNYTILTAFVG